LCDFVEGVMADRVFLADLEDFVEPLIAPGRVNSLAQVLLKLTSPGVPDIYQGTELWDLSLVDPDNRRPVDYGERRSLLAEAESMSAAETWAKPDTGAPKLLVTKRALALRTAHPELFGASSSYEPLRARGERADHVVAFARGGSAVTIVPRLVIGLDGRWGNTSIELPPGQWINVLDETTPVLGGRVGLGPLLGFPVALLAREDGA
jgi:(1->4)-alpha-D-glucan 1-alpha-D-glucosylmutase